MLLLVVLSAVQFFYLNTKKPAQNHYNKNDNIHKNSIKTWLLSGLDNPFALLFGSFLLWTFRSSSNLTAIKKKKLEWNFFFHLKNKAFEKWILLQIGALIFYYNFCFFKVPYPFLSTVNDPFLIQDFLFVWGVEKYCFCSTIQQELWDMWAQGSLYTKYTK